MTRQDTRETGPSGRRFGATELPPEIERVVQQAKRLEWATLGVIVVTIVLVAIVMGSSQAMRAAWIEDLLSLIPPIAFLVALRVARMAPTRARPYGSHRSVGVGHLVAAVALSVMGVVLVGDSVLGLVTAEHPPIGTFDLFGHTVWQGWFMMAVMALSVPGPMILGHKKLKLAEQLGAPGGRQDQAQQHPHGGGLAGAVGAEEAVDVALLDLEVEGVDGGDAPEPLGQRLGPQDRAHRSSPV